MWRSTTHGWRLRAWRWMAWGRRVLSAGLLLTAAFLLTADPAPGAAAGVPVLVAARDLAAGTVLSAADLRTVDFPLALAPDGALGPGDVPEGTVLAAPVRTGEPLTDVRLPGPGLTASLGPGQTAVPIRLGDADVVHLLRPGDRIDLYSVDVRGAPGSDLVAAHTLVLSVPTIPDDVTAGGGIVVVRADRATAAALLASLFSGALAATLSPP